MLTKNCYGLTVSPENSYTEALSPHYSNCRESRQRGKENLVSLLSLWQRKRHRTLNICASKGTYENTVKRLPSANQQEKLHLRLKGAYQVNLSSHLNPDPKKYEGLARIAEWMCGSAPFWHKVTEFESIIAPARSNKMFGLKWSCCTFYLVMITS